MSAPFLALAYGLLALSAYALGRYHGYRAGVRDEAIARRLDRLGSRGAV
jgi:hypothetical protein